MTSSLKNLTKILKAQDTLYEQLKQEYLDDMYMSDACEYHIWKPSDFMLGTTTPEFIKA